MKDTPYLHKKPHAVPAARLANMRLSQAIELVNQAEDFLFKAGYRSAAHGASQARKRLESWHDKVRAAIARRQAAERLK